MTRVQRAARHLGHMAEEAQDRLEHRITAQVAEAVARQQAATAATLAQQQKDLYRLEARLDRLGRQRSGGGGFSWLLLLAAGGGAYALYRSNPTVREQVQGLLKRASPGAEGNLARAGDAVKDAVSRVRQGQDPQSDLRAAGGEVRRAGEKLVVQVNEGAREGHGRS